MSQRKIDKIFKELSDVLGIPEVILVVGYDKDDMDHDYIQGRVMKTCRKENLKLNTDQCHFRYMSIPYIWVIVSRCEIQPDPHKLLTLIELPYLN